MLHLEGAQLLSWYHEHLAPVFTKTLLVISPSNLRPIVEKWVPSESQILNTEKEEGFLLGVPTSFLPCNIISEKHSLKESMLNWFLCFRA